MSRCGVVYSCLGRGDVLASHSCALEIGESVQRVTLKYGDPSDLQDYQGGRDEKDLKKFASEKLGPQCGTKNLHLCSDEKKAQIAAFQAMGSDKLGEFIGEQEAKIKDLNENFSKQVEDLQKLYEGYMKDKEAAEAALKGQGLGLAKAVRKSLEAKTDEL